ncbi:MAG: GNAT family N-acetyltransferase [Firmicutes bacterium]|nr:GNAT family N-acetyltransferase [Bacillota bacterium]
MEIRRAAAPDIPKINDLLSQVLELHAALRPDIFVPGTAKYTTEELLQILADDERPVFVAVDGADQVLGYAFCVVQHRPVSNYMIPGDTLYLDDLCVDAAGRGQGVGRRLFRFVQEEARRRGCGAVTLNVWEGNDRARAFYDSLGMKVRETQLEYILTPEEG